MNTKSGKFTHSYATQENAAFGVIAVRLNSILRWILI